MNWFRSIRWRFQLWYGLSLVLVLCGFGFTAYHLQRTERLRQIDGELQRRLSVVAGAIVGGRPPLPPPGGPPPPPPQGPRELRLSEAEEALFGEGGPESFYYAVWLRNGPPFRSSANAPADLPIPNSGEPPPRQRGSFREIFISPNPDDFVLVGCSLETEVAALRQRQWELTGAGAAVLLLGLLGGWWLTTHALRPLGQIAAAATKIAGGRLGERIPALSDGSELGQLVQVLNSTFARLEEAFAQQARFTSDAAHELRTPVTVLLTETQSVLVRARSPEEYRLALETCQRAGQRMRRLIESLLELATLDAGQAGLSRVPFDLAMVCRECVELLEPLARERQVVICCDLPETACEGDPERIAQVVTNLITNAVQHSGAGCEVRISLLPEKSSVVLVISDNGRGIPADQLPHIFERFYRGDASRSRRTGSTGLGLAITRSIVEAHQGRIWASSRAGKGTEIAVELPVSAIALTVEARELRHALKDA